MKTCSKCKVPKPGHCFHRYHRTSDGLQSRCKECAARAQRGNPKIAAYSAKYRAANLELCRARCSDWQRRNLKWFRDYAKSHPEQTRAANKRSKAKRFKENPEEVRAVAEAWKKANPDKVAAHRRKAMQNVQRHLGCSLRGRIRGAIKYASSNSRLAKELLGCPVIWLEAYLEEQFQPGMTWENYGPVWHIDHIKPCAKFDLTDPEQQKICFHWTNLQPLFAADNLRKSDHYE